VTQDRLVQRALQAGLEAAVEGSEEEHSLAVAAERVEVLSELDPGLGEGPRLVCAEHVHAAQVVDRGEALDDHLPCRHAKRPARETDGDDHREQLGREADGEREGEQEGLEPRPMQARIDEHDRQHQEEG
jgi:hypothetical protein